MLVAIKDLLSDSPIQGVEVSDGTTAAYTNSSGQALLPSQVGGIAVTIDGCDMTFSADHYDGVDVWLDQVQGGGISPPPPLPVGP